MKPQSQLTDSELARVLLSRGRTVGAPAHGSVARTIARVEAAASAGLLIGGTGLGVAQAATQSTALAGSSLFKSVGASIVAKWFISGMAVGIAGGGFVAGAIVVTAQRPHAMSEPPAAAASASSARIARSPKRTMRREQSEETIPTTASISDVTTPRVDVPSETLDANRRSAEAVKQRTAPISPELARELGMLDQARAALERGDAAQAVYWLDQHRRQFPNGQLVPEAGLLRQRAESQQETNITR